MAYTFTNTITTLPYDYYLKFEIIADAGTTGSLTETNGGYIMDVSEISHAIDDGKGAYKPGSVSIKLRNIDSVFSTNVFTDSITDIELRIWISYDTGLTYENLFCGFVNYKARQYSERDTTDATQRIYEVSAYASFMRLRYETLTSTSLITNPVANLVTVTTGFDIVTIPEDEKPRYRNNSGTYQLKFAKVPELYKQMLGRIPFISGSLQPTTAISENLDGMTLWHDDGASGVSTTTFDDFLIVYEGVYSSFYGYNSLSKIAARQAKNYLELLRRTSESFMFVVIPRLTESAGSYTYTLYIEPFLGTLSGSAVSSLPTEFYKKDFDGALWYDAIQISTPNLPVQDETGAYYGGKNREFNTLYCTAPSIASHYNIFIESATIKQDDRNISWSNDIGSQQLFMMYSGAPQTVHKFKHRTHQSLFEATPGYYGVQKSAADLALVDADRSLATRGQRRTYVVRYKTLKGSDIWDLRVNKTVTVDGTTCKIYQLKRNILRNTTECVVMEEA